MPSALATLPKASFQRITLSLSAGARSAWVKSIFMLSRARRQCNFLLRLRFIKCKHKNSAATLFGAAALVQGFSYLASAETSIS